MDARENTIFLFSTINTPFGQIWKKKKNCQFKLKLDSYTNLSMKSLTVVFTFSVIYRKYPFCVNLVQKIKIISLSWDLVLRLIWICTIQWWCSFFVFDWKYPFLANLVQKIKFVSFSWNLVPTLIRICTILWWCSIFLFQTRNIFFRQIWSKKKSNCQFKLKFDTEINSNM